MNRTYVLDASALLVLMDNRPNARRVKRLIDESAGSNTTLLASVVNLGEVFYISWHISPGSVRENNLHATPWMTYLSFPSKSAC